MARATTTLNVEVQMIEMTPEDFLAWVLATETLFRIRARIESSKCNSCSDTENAAIDPAA